VITIVHGGQTGVDRGAHEAAINNGWSLAGYMTRDQRDELGQIPPDVARFLVAIDKTSYAARTEANVRAATAALIVVQDANDPGVTPGTAKTIDLVMERRMRRTIVDPQADATVIARWIWTDLRMMSTLPLPLEIETKVLDPVPTRLLVAGPRESKWRGARVETAALLRRVGLALVEIARPPVRKET
jgi:hypothetical protein